MTIRRAAFAGFILSMGMAQAALVLPPDSVVNKLGRADRPVKEKGVYVIPENRETVDPAVKGIPAPRRTIMTAADGTETVFVLDSLVGRLDSGEYTVKEAYKYDASGNSREARMYNWDYDNDAWQMTQEILLDWDDRNQCISSEKRFVNPWGDDSAQRMTMTYDEAGFNTGLEIYNLEAGEWIPAQKSTYSYDSYGYMTEELIELPSEDGGWEFYSRNVAEWTADGDRTLFEFYLWSGTEWEPADSRIVRKYDEQRRLLSDVEQIVVDGGYQNFLRILQEFGPYGLTMQTYEFWNDENNDWLGYEDGPSMYSSFEYDGEGRCVRETCYAYDFGMSDWAESIVTESEYTALADGITREERLRFDVKAGNILAHRLEREYNRAGNDTYFKEYIKEYLEGPLFPFKEVVSSYDESGTILLSEELYQFEGETRVAEIKNTFVYDSDGCPVESLHEQGKYLMTGEGDPDEWMNYTHFLYDYKQGQELSRMAYIWDYDEYVPFWGQSTELNFDVPISQCIYWLNSELVPEYQITASRVWRPDGTEWTYEEGLWHYSKLSDTGVTAAGETTLSVYPNPASDMIYVNGEVEGMIRVYSMQGSLVASSGERKVDVSHLPSGLYIVNAGGRSFRLVKN